MSLVEQPWYTGNGRKVNLIQVIKALVSDDPIYERIVHIGTDGQRRRKRPGVSYVTVVAVHNKGKGATGFYTRKTSNIPVSLREKLFQETWNSLEVALALESVVPRRDQILVHVDANPNSRWASSRYYKQLAGMVEGNGFRYILKPDAWCASHAADHYVKSKHYAR
jgi:predicted RNase H-related nuclease YkuK (DUF458 family)